MHLVQDVFDLPFHMARDQIEQSLRAKMSIIKVRIVTLTTPSSYILDCCILPPNTSLERNKQVKRVLYNLKDFSMIML